MDTLAVHNQRRLVGEALCTVIDWAFEGFLLDLLLFEVCAFVLIR